MAVQIISRSALHSGYLSVHELRLRLANGEEVRREVEEHGRAVGVLPYDPERRMALMIRLLRAPVLLATGAQDLLEVPAGMIEEADPQETARRELQEEVGLQACDLEHVACVFTSPGVSTERMDLFLARYSHHGRTGAGGGVASEQENITVCELPLAELWAMLERKEIADMKTLTLLLALKMRQPDLFAAQGAR